jgi:hypothetical protein
VENVIIDEYGEAVNDFSEFEGFRNYRKNKDSILDQIRSLFTYLKFSEEVRYFEHNDYMTNSYKLDGLDREPRVLNIVRMDWVVFGFDVDKYGDENCNDLVIAIDVFDNGNSKLRIHSPYYCLEKFNKHFESCNGKFKSGYFMTMQEDEFVDHIRDLINIV